MSDESNWDNAMPEENKPGLYIKARHILALMDLLVMVNMYLTRSTLNVAIVAMVNTTSSTENANTTSSCPPRETGNASVPTSNGMFSWDAAEQGILLGSYYYGYMLTNLPGAWLSQRFGFSKVLLVVNAITTLITIVTPLVAYQSFELLLASRIVLGFVHGPTFPSAFGSWTAWSPKQEISFFISLTVSGTSFGTGLSLALSGLIAGGLGWEEVFYITGGLSGLVTIMWFFLVYDSPEKHPRISDEEKRYITQNNHAANNNFTSKKLKVPWLSMLTSLPLIGMVISHFSLNFGAYTLLTMLPTYMATILQFNVATSGVLSALPYVLEWLFTVSGGYVTDQLKRRRLASIVLIRKINNTIGLTIPAVFIVLAGYIGCNAAAAVAFFTLAVGFQAITVSGCRGNAVDIAPAFSGIAFGISNTIANTPGFIAPLVGGIILKNDSSISGWQSLFWISAGIYMFGALVFLILGSGKEQEWAKVKDDTKSNIEGFDNSAADEDTKL